MKRSREPDEEFPEYPTSSPSPAPADRDTSTPPPPAVKIAHLDPDSAFVQDQDKTVMKCSLPPHKETLSFPSYEEYESHYNKTHTNRCLECRKNFPSEHLLGLHIEECHDSFLAVKRERGDRTYSCFVEACEKICRTPQKRRFHMIDKHGYPRNYFFALTKEGIDGRRSLLLEGGHRRRSSSNYQSAPKATRETVQPPGISENTSTPSSENTTPSPEKPASKVIEKKAGPSAAAKKTNGDEKQDADSKMADLTGAMSALQFVPPSVKFGRGGGRAGFSRR